MWPVSLEAMLGTLGLKILLIEDAAATARTLALRTKVNSSNQRFGNRCNSPKLLSAPSNEGEKINMPISRPAHVAPQREPPPVSRAHLRVVQSRRRSKHG